MEIENIKDCINITGNAGHNIEYRRALIELKSIEDKVKKMEEAIKVYLLMVGKGEITVFPSDNDKDYLGLLEDSIK